jgi:hypothetical protein
MYCTVANVLSLAGIPSATNGGPISDADITQFILYAQAVVNNYCNTTFLSVETTATATTASTTTTLATTGTSWTTNQYATNYMVEITSGTGIGQLRKITSNTTTTLTVTPTFTTTADDTSVFEVYPNTILSETRDGNNLAYFYTRYYPIHQLQSLTIDTTSITTTAVYLYSDLGKIRLKDAAEASLFNNTNPQSILLGYAYGVYPIPVIIQEYTATLAAIKTLLSQLGGSYRNVESYTIPEMTVNKGGQYQKIRETLEQLKAKEASMKPLLPYFPNFA